MSRHNMTFASRCPSVYLPSRGWRRPQRGARVSADAITNSPPPRRRRSSSSSSRTSSSQWSKDGWHSTASRQTGRQTFAVELVRISRLDTRPPRSDLCTYLPVLAVVSQGHLLPIATAARCQQASLALSVMTAPRRNQTINCSSGLGPPAARLLRLYITASPPPHPHPPSLPPAVRACVREPHYRPTDDVRPTSFQTTKRSTKLLSTNLHRFNAHTPSPVTR